MALREIRFGGGVWKQHEQQRTQLEARVKALEAALTAQRQELTLTQEKQSALTDALKTSERHRDKASHLLILESYKAAASATALVAAHKRCNASEARGKALEQAVVELVARNASQEQQIKEATAHIDQLQRTVERSNDEEVRLCDLLYAAQEESEARGTELERLRRQVRVLSHAKLSSARTSAALEREKLALAQELARVRGSNAVHVSRLPPTRVAICATENPSNGAARLCLKDEAGTGALTPPRSGCGCDGASFLWRELQLAGVKVRRAQSESAQLRERVEALEACERALIVRFRGAASARRRAEQQRPPKKQ